jgi:spore germination cell wall hydrolase CwlJ-like protein
MDKTAKRPRARGWTGGGRALQKRFGLILCAGLALLPATTVEVALQDMTSLLEGARSQARWQATFVPSPAGSIETAKLAFADAADRSRLPRGAGLSTGSGVYTLDTVRESFETPDETRVNRREKGARVLAATPLSLPKAFSAGSILERQSLLRPAVAKDVPGLMAASVKPVASDRAIEVAMAFSPRQEAGSPLPGGTPDRVMIAAIESRKGGRPSKPKLVVDAEMRPSEVASLSPAESVSALGYAPAEPTANPAAALFGRILGTAGNGAGFVPPLGKGDHAWAATPLPPSSYSAREQTCLATGIYFEARGESEEGQAAVAQVILNRVRNPTYPKTICGVVYQNKSWRNRCQFSFACDAQKDKILNKRAYARAKDVADKVTRGEIWLAAVGSSTHYHATYVAPRWAKAMEKVDKIGRHVFYRTYGGGWN